MLLTTSDADQIFIQRLIQYSIDTNNDKYNIQLTQSTINTEIKIKITIVRCSFFVSIVFTELVIYTSSD